MKPASTSTNVPVGPIVGGVVGGVVAITAILALVWYMIKRTPQTPASIPQSPTYVGDKAPSYHYPYVSPQYPMVADERGANVMTYPNENIIQSPVSGRLSS